MCVCVWGGGGVFRKMKILWIFFGVISQGTGWGIFFFVVAKISNIFLGVLEIPDIFFGEW